MKLYPLKLKPAVKEIIWGGDKLKTDYNKSAPFEKLAESWELTVRPDGMNVIENGECAGTTLGDYLTPGLIGRNYSGDRFPLFIKFIDALDRLSIQVHPSDDYAMKNEGEYGKTETFYRNDCLLFAELPEKGISWMSHTDYIAELPEGFTAAAHTTHCPTAAMQNSKRKIYGVQFHPEVLHSENGIAMLHNFLYRVCGCTGDWTMKQYAQTAIAQIRETVGDKKILLGLSGGVDSSVAAALLSKAVGSQLTCIFVDHGLMRKNEGDEVVAAFKDWDINFVRVNAEQRFLDKLAGVSEPEAKRKIIGEEFIRVFEAEAKKIGTVDYLAQGTIYPDVIESGTGDAAVIKSHHNVGGLPEDLQFKLVEPLYQLFKDEVRACGIELGLPHSMVYRQPFPGPGLGVRCLGAITKERLEAVREADAILREEFANAGLDKKVWQYFTVVPDFKSVV